MPHSYQEMSDMFGGRINRPNYDPNKRGLVTGPGGYAGNPHGGGWAMGTKGPGAGSAPDNSNSFGEDLRNQWNDFFSNPNISQTVKDDVSAEQMSVSYGDDQTVSGLTWGGPSAFAGAHDDYGDALKVQSMYEQLAPDVQTDPVIQGVYKNTFGNVDTSPDAVTDAMRSSLATALGYNSVAAMERAKGPQSINTMAAYHAATTNLGAQMDAISGLVSNYASGLAPHKDMDLGDMMDKYGPTVLGATGLYGVEGLAQEHGWNPVLSAIGAIGTEAKIAGMMFNIATGKPSFSAASTGWVNAEGETLAQAIKNDPTGELARSVMKTDAEGNIKGSVGYGLKNNAFAEMMGIDPSYAGAYVDAEKAIAEGWSYAGSTQGMFNDQFSQVSGALVDPYGQTMSQMMSQNQAPQRGERQEVPPDYGTAGDDTPTVDISDFDGGQMALFNQTVNQGYSEEYAYEYVRSLG